MVTVITRTIGPTGRDYTTFTLAEADVTNIGTSADLVANDEAIVFEADAGSYVMGSRFISSLVTDSTRCVTYKPAAGSEHGGLSSAGVRLSHSSAVEILDAYTRFLGIVIESPMYLSGDGVYVDGLILPDDTLSVYSSAYINNCVISVSSGNAVLFAGSSSYSASITNCTIDHSAFGVSLSVTNAGASVSLVNNLLLTSTGGDFSNSGGGTITGSNNFSSGSGFAAFGIQGSPYPITPTTSFSTPLGSGDYAVYMGATGALADVTGNDVWQQGVGPGSNSDVPTTDINGVARSGASCNPGAFEADGFVAPTVITKTIGPSGRDYATFTLAEAAVTSIGSGTDLTFENEAIVFEADAGDYLESLNFDTSGGLTCDATRNVTWTHATGAGHGGQFESGANLVGSCAMREDHAVVDGLSVSRPSGGAAGIFSAPEGVFLRNMMVYSTNSYAIRLDRGATAAFPGVVENCVCKSDSFRPFDIRSEGSGVDAHWRVINTTVFTTGTNVAFQVGSSSSDTLNLELTNVLVLGPRAFFDFGGATLVLTGSNNFGPATTPFPAAIQGSPYPVTATTTIDPGTGDFAIYEQATGRLYDVPGNDVWQGGVGTTNAAVPATDIVGGGRAETTCNPGAFEGPAQLAAALSSTSSDNLTRALAYPGT